MNPFAQLIDLLVGLYVTIILMRFFLQYFRADFYNPLSQFVVKATDPLVKPIRKAVPGFGGIDVSTLLLAYLVILLKTILIVMISGVTNIYVLNIILYPVIELPLSILRLFMYLILIRIVLSWISPGVNNPMTMVIAQVTEPIISKFRKMLPPMSGFDFSPMLALIAIYFIQNLINYYILPLVYFVYY